MYFEDEYEQYLEQQKFDEIYYDFLKKAEESFKQEFKERIDKILEEEKRQIEHREKERIEEMMRKYGLKLKPQQEIWFVKEYSHFHNCEYCNGTGKQTKVIDGVTYSSKEDCPHCHYGRIEEKPTYKVCKGTITMINISLYWTEDKLEQATSWNFDKNTADIEYTIDDDEHTDTLEFNEIFTNKKSAEEEAKRLEQEWIDEHSQSK